MSDIQAALGLTQIKKLNTFVARRNKIAESYTKEFESLPLKIQAQQANYYSAYHLYIIQIRDKNRKKARDALFNHLISNKIAPSLHYMPIMAHPFYRKMGLDVTMYPNAIDYYQASMSVPIFPAMSEASLAYCMSTITSFFE